MKVDIKISVGDYLDRLSILEIKNSDLVVKYNPYNEDDARQMVQNRIGDPKKAEKDLGFKYRYDLKSGLRRLVDWRRKNK